ncbi:hypothetical protein RHS01_03334 [Rhizoctonia solani]|uniref:Uncharacterized protein n=1 Tax=Rhizoctonia solani TaxID=456999 RepID=A0A8H7IHR4_9AGAM|nr:hypothetical protein RHS01_03334 [Rhizoctonia solani]
MISPGDTMATRLWRAHLEYTSTSRLDSKQNALNFLPRPVLSVGTPSSHEDSNNDTSELPYLCTEPVETNSTEFIGLPSGDSFGSEIDGAVLMAMLSGDSDSTSEDTEEWVHSRPILQINPISIAGNIVLSAPSPVDSGYGSRPETPSTDGCGGYGSDGSAWSPVDDTSSISDDSSNTHTLFSDAKYWDHVADAKTAIPAFQGPVIPRIVLSDEEGRVIETTFDSLFEKPSQLKAPVANQDVDSPYGGLMSPTLDVIEPAASATYTPITSKIRNSAFVLSWIVQEEQKYCVKEDNIGEEAANTFVCREEQDEKDLKLQVEVDLKHGMDPETTPTPAENVAWNVNSLTGDERDATQDSMNYDGNSSLLTEAQLAQSSAPMSALLCKSEFKTWCFEDNEDEECEESGLFLTEPDNNYSRLIDSLCKLPCEPAIVFGILKTTARTSPANSDLNTAYHIALRTADVTPVELALSSIVPQLPLRLVGLLPCQRKSVEEDLDDGDLVLHHGGRFRSTENKDVPPRAGASYDEYMSRFMDDVDLSSSNSNDSFKNAPFGKLVGGVLKEMTVPEAVDHLKEGLGKTESAFRVALTAPFRFNSVADKLSQHLKSADQKIQPPKERRGSNAFSHHRKRSSASGIKTKWSNMLNKFTR